MGVAVEMAQQGCLLARWWWHLPSITAFQRQRQTDLCEFEASLVYRVNSRTVRAVTQRNCISKLKKEKQTKSDGRTTRQTERH